ncbi:MAG: IS5 family transposase, partial [Novipirellula sp. JB048]
IHFLCDGKGPPLTAVLSPAQDHESQSLRAVIESTELSGFDSDQRILPAKLAGDKGYRAAWIDDWLLERKIEPVIPSKSNEDRDARAIEFDKASYRQRCIVEQVIGWLKECRRVATRYEKLARNYLSMVKLSMVGRYLRIIAPTNSQA